MSGLHIYVHLINEQSEDANRLFEQMLSRIGVLETQRNAMNAQVQQVIDDLAALRGVVTNITNVSQATVTTLQGFSAILAGVRQQLADLLANGSFSAEDKAALTAAHDTIKQLAVETGDGAQRIVAAIEANPANPTA